ncbi:MAG: putative toxin-antitoxin system toxin component, PIN family [Chloroflexota bacterium]
MLRVFVDSSVLFAAIYSSTGHSADLLQMGVSGKITIVISDDVIEETRRNLEISKPEKLTDLNKALSIAGFEIITVPRNEVLAAAQRVAAKDAHIIAAAKVAKADMLVSFDKKHILGRPELAEYIGAAILSPREAIERIRGYGKL